MTTTETGARPASGQRPAPTADATRVSLIERMKDPGDQGGWQRFYDTYQSAIRGLAVRAGLTAAEADDVVQEVLIAVARNMPTFEYDRSRGSFKGWLFQITRRRIADHFRRKRDVVPLDDELLVETDGRLERQWDEEWRRSLLQQALAAARAGVSPAQWQMFDLAAVQQWPMERITRLLGVSRAQVYMARMRVRKAVRKEAVRLGLEAGDLP